MASGWITTNGTAPFLQPAPAGPPTVAPNANPRSQRLVVGLAGLVGDVADLKRAPVDFDANILTFFIWPTVFDGFTPGSPGALGAQIASYAAAPWLWSVHYRGSYQAFNASQILVPSVLAGTAFDQITAMGDAVCPVGAQVGTSIESLLNIGFKLRVEDPATYPNAVVVIDYFMARNTQG